MNKRIILVFILLIFFGCLSKPKPFNETTFFQSLPKYKEPEPKTPPSLEDVKLICVLNGLGKINNTLYIHGRNMKSEYIDNNTNKTFITITKGERYYINHGLGYPIPENCTWITFSQNSFKTQNYSTQQLQNISFNQSDFFDQSDLFSNFPNCVRGNFSSEIFKINGTVCDLEAILYKNNT